MKSSTPNFTLVPLVQRGNYFAPVKNKPSISALKEWEKKYTRMDKENRNHLFMGILFKMTSDIVYFAKQIHQENSDRLIKAVKSETNYSSDEEEEEQEKKPFNWADLSDQMDKLIKKRQTTTEFKEFFIKQDADMWYFYILVIKKAIEVDVDNNIQVYISLMETPDFVMAMLLCSCIKKLTFKVHLFENLPKLLATLKTMLVNSIEMYITRQINLFKDGQITFDQLKRLFTHDEVITKIPEINQTAELYYKLVRYAEHFDLSSTHVTKAKIQGVISNLKM